MKIDIKDIKLETNRILERQLENLGSESLLPKTKNMYASKYGMHWAGAIGVDIKNFDILCQNNSREDIIKTVQAFVSGVLSIVRINKMYRKSWVNESDMTSLFSCKTKREIIDLMLLAKYINSFANYLLADALKQNGFQGTFKVGVGVWLSEDDSFICYGEEISEKEFHQTVIGKAVKNAAYLAKCSGKKYRSKILFNALIRKNWTGMEVKRFEKEKWIRTFNDVHTGEEIFGHSVRFNSFAQNDDNSNDE